MRTRAYALQVSNQIERGLLGMGAAEAGSHAEQQLRVMHLTGTQVLGSCHDHGLQALSRN